MENHFDNFESKIKEVLVSKRFQKDADNFDISLITDSQHEHFTRLHKFEKHVRGNNIFRAVKDEIHYVYAIDKKFRLIFLRVFKNFKKYEKYLGDEKLIEMEIEGV
jgi:hypothetical protein